MPACPSCGKDLPGEFPFCPFCGAAINGDQRAPVREERKVITVLFCDLVGSTAQADQLDPEDVRALLSRYHAHVKGELERFGGTVEKFIGDAVVALFGAPKAHEDDPERAVRAALVLRDWVAGQPDLSVRIAVNTGEALVALGARLDEGEGMASGDVLNTAARMQSAAPVDGILVGEQTYRATERVIEYRATDPIVAKGKPEPVAVWEAVGARTRFGVDLAVPSTPLVGRERELSVLTSALDRVCVERTPQLLTLVGVPGIGKSRLVAELFAAADQRDELITWRQGRSLPYGAGGSYWAFGEIVKAQAGVLESDQPEVAGQKLGQMVAALLREERDGRWVTAHLRPLAGLEGSAGTGDRRGEAFAAWRRYVEALAEGGPVVLVFEDLHWADDGMLDFVDHLAERLAEVPVLLIATARPELYARRSAWGGGKLNATAVSLAPLSDDQTSELIGRLISENLLSADAQTQVLDRAGGNPLYAQEFVRMATDRVDDGRDLPETVQGIIAARLDSLPEEDKALLQYASVVGSVFWSGAVASVGGEDRFEIEEQLHELERREFVRRERQSSVDGETEYAFRHALVREVAYGSIPRRERADCHGRAAEWIEAIGRPEDHADLLAYHYLAALDLRRATSGETGPVPPGALDALLLAGDRAFALNAFPDAARFYEQALDLGADRDGDHLFRLGIALMRMDDARARESFEEARDAFLVAGEPDRAAEAECETSNHWWYTGNHAEAQRARDRAEALLEDRRETAATARALAILTSAAMVAFDNERTIELGRECLTLGERLGLTDVVARALGLIGIARAYLGEVTQGLADMREAKELATESRLPIAGALANNLAQTTWELGGDRAEAEAIHLEAIEQGDFYADAPNVRWHRAMLIGLSYDLGRWDEALERADRFIADCETAPHYLEPLGHQIRALISLSRGDHVAAVRSAERSLELTEDATDPQARAANLATVARAHVEAGNVVPTARVAAIRTLLSERRFPYAARAALEVFAEPLGLIDDLRAFWTDEPEANARTVALAILDGDPERAADILRETNDFSREAYVRMHAARRLAQSGDRRGAQEQAELALAFFRPVGARAYVEECESYVTG